MKENGTENQEEVKRREKQKKEARKEGKRERNNNKMMENKLMSIGRREERKERITIMKEGIRKSKMKIWRKERK